MGRRAENHDPLGEYNAKRDFGKTAEPAGAPGKPGSRVFMVQKHDATRLHYDLRLEKGGVLKSWAVTRGPSLDPKDKRLAVRTEDHPMSYAAFEGTIPKGEYGGGTVMLWDRGIWTPIKGKKADDLEDGHLHFVLDGERMQGEWLLVRMKKKPGEKRENWLLRKIDDAHAGAAGGLTERYLTSVATGRTMEEIAAGETAPKRAGDSIPRFRPPQLATLVDHVPPGNDWLHEMKYDGYRALLAVGGGKAKVFTRAGKDWTAKFSGIAAAAAQADLGSALIDGEIVALDADGRPDFARLKNMVAENGANLTFFAFDLLESGGVDLAKFPNIERKAKLRALIPQENAILRYADHVTGKGEKLFEAMCAEHLEGIISKRAEAPYRGKRTTAWVKVKCVSRQEFVIVGWAKSSVRGRPFASLLLAQHDHGELIYRGKVGTGFDAGTMADLAAKLKPLQRKTPPLDVPGQAARGAVWVTPKLVAEIAFAEFTPSGAVRHASFIGLRVDKDAAEVRTERARPAASVAETPDVKISSAERVIFPDAGITKGGLADYYRKIGSLMLPSIARRPISLVRCPQGRGKACFFQKHDPGSFGEHVLGISIEEKSGKTKEYLYVEDRAGLIACVQMGTIEFHGWGARVGDIETPDRMIFDLDPDAGLDFRDVKQAAKDIRDHLADTGLTSFPMLSGGKGLHVVVPLTPKASWPAVKDFASRFAQALAGAEPKRFTATMSKSKRKGRIFIDWLRNQRGSTAVLPYSARARVGAPVAAPIGWGELSETEGGGRFHVGDADLLLRRARSIALEGWGEAEQILPDV